MRQLAKIAVLSGVLALAAAPALATAKPDDVPRGKGQGAHGDPTPGPKAGLPAKAKAYGRYCKTESRKREEGEKRSAFSRCVTAMAKAANGVRTNPRKACKGMSKKHDGGGKGTEFSRCVKAAAKLRRQQREDRA